MRSGSNSRGDRLLRERRACAQRYAHRCRGLALYRHRQQQHAGAMGMEDEDMVLMTVLTIMGPPLFLRATGCAYPGVNCSSGAWFPGCWWNPTPHPTVIATSVRHLLASWSRARCEPAGVG